jgi:hypothetical protein
LLLVAAVQLGLVYVAELTPWLGGGFGMFSTTRVDGTRHVHAFVLRPGIERGISVPSELADLKRHVRALPSDRNLERLGLALAGVETPDHGAPQATLIRVWETLYDPQTLLPVSRILRELKIPFSGGR